MCWCSFNILVVKLASTPPWLVAKTLCLTSIRTSARIYLTSASTRSVSRQRESCLARVGPPRPVSRKTQTALIWQLDWARPLAQRADIDYERKTVREGEKMKGEEQERRRKRRRWPLVLHSQNIISMTWGHSLPLLFTSKRYEQKIHSSWRKSE